MDLKKLLVVLCALVGLACGAGSSAAREQPAPAQSAPVQRPQPARDAQNSVELGETVVLKTGDTTEVASKDVSIRFARLVSDSRCATGMVCVWEGEAVVELTLAEPGRGERTTAALASTGRGGRQSAEFAACRVDLVAVSSGGDQVTLRVSKA
ncbi:hypothetical protein [Amycolatopsis keratiniphila]|uniref:hypothetical protein n=1 Tax=Amycolatopsis keratiniphila TaxID=129921 RepID=UPI00087C402F|nr:hypothetical protein [Amycolatopsis keratiniphila]OLZ48508.1 hypothetical protein BS330_32015 [Amycolatopsis keratiniphila subsp. nogabecina]SDU37463.1 hypothetical protein SAMN04489733_3527 [Amycolatopsis keratiniphila]